MTENRVQMTELSVLAAFIKTPMSKCGCIRRLQIKTGLSESFQLILVNFTLIIINYIPNNYTFIHNYFKICS